jgi:hypothetical protein
MSTVNKRTRLEHINTCQHITRKRRQRTKNETGTTSKERGQNDQHLITKAYKSNGAKARRTNDGGGYRTTQNITTHNTQENDDREEITTRIQNQEEKRKYKTRPTKNEPGTALGLGLGLGLRLGLGLGLGFCLGLGLVLGLGLGLGVRVRV